MMKRHTFIACAAISILALGIFFLGCEDQSENIPTSPETIESFMAQGWAYYAADDFVSARESFQEANQRNVLYLPAYNGLGWCSVRMTDFSDAAVQFSFIITLADPATEADLLADAYAGLCLSATIERSVLEISGEATQDELNALAQESIDMAQVVFDLFPADDYAPADHDPGFGSAALHLFNAQNYFYLQEFGNCEAELTVVDTAFVDDQLAIYGTAELNEVITNIMVVVDLDTLWFLYPANLGIHHYTDIVPPDTLWSLDYSVMYDENRIQILPGEGVELQGGLDFIVSYVYIDDFATYLFELINQIENLIEF